MLVSGPGIAAGSTLADFVGSHADLAPTWLALAGLKRAPEMDGSPLIRSLIRQPADLPTTTMQRWTEEPPEQRPKMAYVEYHGLGNVPPSYVDPVATPNIRLMVRLQRRVPSIVFSLVLSFKSCRFGLSFGEIMSLI